MSQLRLQVLLARAGLASRRKCELLITEGHVRVNGQVVRVLGTKVDPAHDEVDVDGKRVTEEELVYLLLHKPRGRVTTLKDPEGRPTVMELVAKATSARLFPVGRLDFNTDGVLLLTNDGDLANALMHPRHGVTKTYHAKIQGLVGEDLLDRLRRGVRLDDGSKTAPAEVAMIDVTSGGPGDDDTRGNTWIEITLREGKNRQVHRMVEALHHTVIKLSRVRYANLTVAGVRAGGYRALRPEELAELRSLAGLPTASPRKAARPVPPSPPRARSRDRPRPRRH